MLSCREVIARHSEFRDGEMPSAEAERWRAHLAECALCARYDRVLRKGVRLLSETPVLEPDPAFALHLRYRLADEERRMALRPATMGAAASVSVAAVLALAAWLPIMLVARSNTDTTPVAAAASHLNVTAAEIAWHGGNAMNQQRSHERPSVTLHHTSFGVSLIEPGYSPVIIEPPTAPPTYTRVAFNRYDAR